MANPKAEKTHVLKVIGNRKDNALGVTSSPSTTIEIVIDIKEESKLERALGQMVYVVVKEDGNNILVIGQIVSVRTENRWHEDPSFKGVIKRHGKLPHLSGTADNRIASISVQACYNLGPDTGETDPAGYILGTSPSTGERVEKMSNEVMQELMKNHEGDLTYIGKVYGTNVDLPFWFKHFDKDDEKNAEKGAGDAYHIGVFGKTGSGKTVTASMMLLGYAKNKHNLSILVLDPQSQFFNDKDLLPNGGSLKAEVEKIGMQYERLSILKDVYLPGDETHLFGDLLLSNGFIKKLFPFIQTEDKLEAARDALVEHLSGNPTFNLNNVPDYAELLAKTIKSFSGEDESSTRAAEKEFSKFIKRVYSQPMYRERMKERLEILSGSISKDVASTWNVVCALFAKKNSAGKLKQSVDDIVKKTVDKNGNFIILDLSAGHEFTSDESLEALFVNVIERKIKSLGVKYYTDGKKANCLIVMDEAHRFISYESSDPRITSLTNEIVDSVRTTRKYGIGYMFITQTIESLDKEILRQIRIYGFGYGLTSGPELRKVSEIVNNDSAVELYRSFIDPSNNKKFPFMFFGPVSPLSFTGSPLFVEVYGDMSQFK